MSISLSEVPKLYMLRKDIPLESLFDMKSAEGLGKKWEKTGVARKDFNGYDPSTRDGLINYAIQPKDFPEVTNILENMVNIWNPTLDPKRYRAHEFNYIQYGKGHFFKKHRDRISESQDGKTLKSNNVRIFSTSTIISKTDDLEGGEFLIWSGDGLQENINLEVGQTIFFSSTTEHEVTPVIKGVREVLVAWIYER